MERVWLARLLWTSDLSNWAKSLGSRLHNAEDKSDSHEGWIMEYYRRCVRIRPVTNPVSVAVMWYANFNLLTNHGNRLACKQILEVRFKTESSQMPSMFLLALVAACLFPLCGARRYTNYTSSWLVKVEGGEEVADAVATKFNLINRGQVGILEGVYHLAMAEEIEEHLPNMTDAMAIMPNVTRVEQQHKRKRETRDFTFPTDPLWSKQWNLFNGASGQDGPTKFDLNVVPAWIQGYTGKGVVVSVVDEGVQISHPDLESNIDLSASHNYMEGGNNPSPRKPSTSHGTSCAGEIAMVRDNNYCGAGVAYDCSLGGIRINLGALTDITEANALSFNNSHVGIYSSSWGPTDNGLIVGGPEWATIETLKLGVKQGRNGLGNIYVWASGNGGQNFDSCAADGYSSCLYTISVGSASRDGTQAFYDEDCSGKMATTFSYSSQQPQVSTTTTQDHCISSFTGTSASAPMAAGVIALALEANPTLTWRDVQYLLAYTSNPTLLSGQWTTNGAGLQVSHQFGFGAIDAEAMVTRATRWINVPPQRQCTPDLNMRDNISRKGRPLIITFSGNCPKPNPQVVFLEHVVVRTTLNLYMDLNSNVLPKRGDISIELVSPAGTKSILLPQRKNDIMLDGYEIWPFMSVHHWGENPAGEWKINISFASSGGYVSVSYIEVELYGTDEIPEALANIPRQCSPECARGCSGNESQNCDACKDLRLPDTLECVSNCTFLGDSFCEVSGYCLSSEACRQHGLQGVYIAIIVTVSSVAILIVVVSLSVCVCVIRKRRRLKKYDTLS